MSIFVECLPLGPLPTNCYLCTESKSGYTAVIDPGAWGPQLQQAIADKNVRHIWLTHGHFDHIMGVAQLQQATGARVYVHSADKAMLTDAALNLCAGMGLGEVEPFQADALLRDNDSFGLGPVPVRVIHTPGHTAGGCCFMLEDLLFTGDTLMRGTMGRTDFPTGDYAQLLCSLQKLKELPGDYRVLPGHEAESTLDWERRHNPYMEPEKYGLTAE